MAGQEILRSRTHVAFEHLYTILTTATTSVTPEAAPHSAHVSRPAVDVSAQETSRTARESRRRPRRIRLEKPRRRPRGNGLRHRGNSRHSGARAPSRRLSHRTYYASSESSGESSDDSGTRRSRRRPRRPVRAESSLSSLSSAESSLSGAEGVSSLNSGVHSERSSRARSHGSVVDLVSSSESSVSSGSHRAPERHRQTTRRTQSGVGRRSADARKPRSSTRADLGSKKAGRATRAAPKAPALTLTPQRRPTKKIGVKKGATAEELSDHTDTSGSEAAASNSLNRLLRLDEDERSTCIGVCAGRRRPGRRSRVQQLGFEIISGAAEAAKELDHSYPGDSPLALMVLVHLARSLNGPAAGELVALCDVVNVRSAREASRGAHKLVSHGTASTRCPERLSEPAKQRWRSGNVQTRIADMLRRETPAMKGVLAGARTLLRLYLGGNLAHRSEAMESRRKPVSKGLPAGKSQLNPTTRSTSRSATRKSRVASGKPTRRSSSAAEQTASAILRDGNQRTRNTLPTKGRKQDVRATDTAPAVVHTGRQLSRDYAPAKQVHVLQPRKASKSGPRASRPHTRERKVPLELQQPQALDAWQSLDELEEATVLGLLESSGDDDDSHAEPVEESGLLAPPKTTVTDIWGTPSNGATSWAQVAKRASVGIA